MSQESQQGLPRALIVFGSLLAFGMCIAAFILGTQVKGIGSGRQSISVKGLAEKAVKADYAEWEIGTSARGKTFAQALDQLRAIRPKLDAFIAQQGFPADSLSAGEEEVRPFYIEQERPDGRIRRIQDGFEAQQEITIRTRDLGKIAAANKAALEFKAAGNPVHYSSPSYLISNLEEIKMSLIAAATQNAQTRAQEFLKNGNARVGAIRSASQGAFYILRAGDSVDAGDYGGTYDHSSVDKTARVVVTVEYNIAQR
ncbi:MAG: SIMPL domain-containing protein [Betaproteobacteria bacterium]|nr:SIMPL domain-containing protein [Betaproteobacteria bacterium]